MLFKAREFMSTATIVFAGMKMLTNTPGIGVLGQRHTLLLSYAGWRCT